MSTRWREPAVRGRAEGEAELLEPLGQRREPEQPAELPAGDARGLPVHDHGPARVAAHHRDLRGDHAREDHRVLGMVVVALLDDLADTMDVAAVDLGRITDMDVVAAERPRAFVEG